MKGKTRLTMAMTAAALAALGADAAAADCGHTRHVAVKSKDYIFHAYQKR